MGRLVFVAFAVMGGVLASCSGSRPTQGPLETAAASRRSTFAVVGGTSSANQRATRDALRGVADAGGTERAATRASTEAARKAATSGAAAESSTTTEAFAYVEEVAGVRILTCDALKAEAAKNAPVGNLDWEAMTVRTYVGQVVALLDGQPIGTPPRAVPLDAQERAALERSLANITEGDTYCGIVPTDQTKWGAAP